MTVIFFVAMSFRRSLATAVQEPPAERAANIIDKMVVLGGNPAHTLYNQLHARCTERGMGPLPADADALLQGALVRVEVTPIGRGNPHELAAIYFVEDDEVHLWRNLPPDDGDEASVGFPITSRASLIYSLETWSDNSFARLYHRIYHQRQFLAHARIRFCARRCQPDESGSSQTAGGTVERERFAGEDTRPGWAGLSRCTSQPARAIGVVYNTKMTIDSGR